MLQLCVVVVINFIIIIIFEFSPTRLMMVRSCRHTNNVHINQSQMHIFKYDSVILTEIFNTTDMEKVR